MPNSRSIFDVSGSVTSGNEHTSRSNTENVAHNCALSYGTCNSFIIVYSFFINVYDRSYFPVLPIKYLINKDADLTMPFKLATGTKPSVSHLRVLFFSCVVWKSTSHVDKMALNVRH